MTGSKRSSLLLATVLAGTGCIAGCGTTFAGSDPAPSGATSRATGGPIQRDWKLPVDGSPQVPATGLVSAVRRVTPAVVAIDGIQDGSDDRGRRVELLSSGSGIIVDAAGYLVTNNHVVAGARDVTVSLADGRTFPARRIVADPVNDLAVITVEASGLPTARFADSSSLEVGMMVAVIGNALDRGIGMNGGWISRLGVSAQPENTATLYNLIQTDVPINPGNSGGPLIDTAGEVVGIANAKLVGSVVEAVGYAIPSSQAVPIIEELIRRGSVVRSWVGVVLATVNQGVADLDHLPTNHGVMVTKVQDSSPAAEAGIRVGDVIVRFRGSACATSSDLATAIRSSAVGTPVRITLWRGDTELTLSVTPKIDPRS